MNIEKFRTDFLARLASTGVTQRQLEGQSGVQQAAISRFAAGLSGLSFESVVKLWPFVYGSDFPYPTHVPPKETTHAPEQERAQSPAVSRAAAPAVPA